jgi:hypothetical protein
MRDIWYGLANAFAAFKHIRFNTHIHGSQKKIWRVGETSKDSFQTMSFWSRVLTLAVDKAWFLWWSPDARNYFQLPLYRQWSQYMLSTFLTAATRQETALKEHARILRHKMSWIIRYFTLHHSVICLFIDDSFAFISSSLSLHNASTKDQKAGILECARVLIPGGMILVVDLFPRVTFYAKWLIKMGWIDVSTVWSGTKMICGVLPCQTMRAIKLLNSKIWYPLDML